MAVFFLTPPSVYSGRALHEVLERHPTVHEGNRDVVVEALRSIAELMIWGDQHDPSFFDFFAEHQSLAHFHRILAQPDNRSGDVAVQVLQTLSILIQNTRSEQAVYFLFSNNHLNAIVSQEFDIESDEVLAYYVSFLKTIAMKLNGETVQFFFNQGSNGGARRFPLFSQALKFHAHEESMVRAAVRTLTLQVYALRDEEICAFILRPDSEEGRYFGCLGEHLHKAQHQLEKVAQAVGEGSVGAARLETDLDGLDDLLCYCSDVYSVGSPAIGAALAEGLWGGFVERLVQGLEAPLVRTDELAPPGPKQPSPTPYIELLCGLHTLERVLQFLQVPELQKDLASALLEPQAAAAEGPRQALLLRVAEACLQSRDVRLAAAVVGLSVALVCSHHMPRAVLARAGLLPPEESVSARDCGEHGERIEAGEEAAGSAAGGQNGGVDGPREPQNEGGGGGLEEKAEVGRAPQADGGAWLDLLLPLLAWDLHPSVLVQVGWLAWRARGSAVNDSSGEGRGALAEAYRMTLAAYLEEVEGPWCDGLPLLFTRAWNRHSYQMKRPGPRTDLKVADLTSPVSAAAGLPGGDEEAPPGGGEGNGDGERGGRVGGGGGTKQRSSSAAAARVHAGADRLAALRVVRGALEEGRVPEEPPLGAAGLKAVTLGFPEGAQDVVPEGGALDLAAVETIPCKVSFSQGAERNVLFVARGHSSPPAGGVPGSPSVLLVEPAPAAEPCGRVVAMAPLAGAEPAVDPTHGHWLHVRIRPPLNALVQRGTSGGGGRRSSKARYIDGRWTLAFSDERGAARARDLVEENRLALRGACAATLEPLGLAA